MDADLSLEVTAPSPGGGRREEISVCQKNIFSRK